MKKKFLGGVIAGITLTLSAVSLAACATGYNPEAPSVSVGDASWTKFDVPTELGGGQVTCLIYGQLGANSSTMSCDWVAYHAGR